MIEKIVIEYLHNQNYFAKIISFIIKTIGLKMIIFLGIKQIYLFLAYIMTNYPDEQKCPTFNYIDNYYMLGLHYFVALNISRNRIFYPNLKINEHMLNCRYDLFSFKIFL